MKPNMYNFNRAAIYRLSLHASSPKNGTLILGSRQTPIKPEQWGTPADSEGLGVQGHPGLQTEVGFKMGAVKTISSTSCFSSSSPQSHSVHIRTLSHVRTPLLSGMRLLFKKSHSGSLKLQFLLQVLFSPFQVKAGPGYEFYILVIPSRMSTD